MLSDRIVSLAAADCLPIGHQIGFLRNHELCLAAESWGWGAPFEIDA